MAYEYIRSTYNVPAEYGMVVILDSNSSGKRRGVIVEDLGNYVGVLFDDKKPTQVEVCHPDYNLEYTGRIETPRTMTKSQLRYKKYLEYIDCFDSFLQFLRSPLAKDI